MIVFIIVFLIAIISLFGMLMFRAWEIRTSRIEKSLSTREIFPEMHFRHVEKIMLHLAKYVVQWIILVIVKYWFIIYTKAKKWAVKNWPKVYNLFKGKGEDTNPQKYSFMERARLELKAKIRHTREKVRKEHEE